MAKRIIRPVKERFPVTRLVAGWNAIREHSTSEYGNLKAMGALVVGEYVAQPEVLCVLWSLYAADTGEMLPVQLDMGRALVRQLCDIGRTGLPAQQVSEDLAEVGY